MERVPPVVVVGSGLAGLSCALELARQGVQVVVVTPCRAGRDGATQRVHALAPWILLTAPRERGDSPQAFLADLVARGEGCLRPDVTAVFAQGAHRAAAEIVELLRLEPLGSEPVLLPGDAHRRGLRCRPRERGPLLAPLVAACRDAGVTFAEHTLAVGLVVGDGGRVGGIVAHRGGARRIHEMAAAAVVLACGGTGAVFPVATAPRWCRGSAVALGAAAGALLHQPQLVQVLPVTVSPPGFFPGTAALVGSRLEVDGRATPWDSGSVDGLGRLVARMTKAGRRAVLRPGPEEETVLPRPLQQRRGAVLTAAVHHGIGGVAIDAWGRTSLPGLYACGEAAGGVQGRRRTMGTGLIEARVFGVRVAQAVIRDRRRAGALPEPVLRATCPRPARAEELERRLDALMADVVGGLDGAALAAAAQELSAWPEGDGAARTHWLAGLRLAAARAILAGELEALGNTNKGSGGL